MCSEPQAGPCASHAHVGQSTLSLGKLRPKDEETASRAHGQRTTHEREVESKSTTFVWLCPCRFFPRNRPQEAARSELQQQTRV